MKKVVIFGAAGHTGKYITRKMQLIAHLLLLHDFPDEGHNRPHLRVLSAISRKDILFPYYLRRAGCFLHRNHAGRLTCCVPDAKEGGYVLGVNAMEAGDIRQTDAMKKAYQMGCEV